MSELTPPSYLTPRLSFDELAARAMSPDVLRAENEQRQRDTDALFNNVLTWLENLPPTSAFALDMAVRRALDGGGSGALIIDFQHNPPELMFVEGEYSIKIGISTPVQRGPSE